MHIYYVTYRFEIVGNELSNKISHFITASCEKDAYDAVMVSDDRVAKETIKIRMVVS